ncbi:hypothetical protein [Undibacterium oligocarboniphilum]|uniref:Uncharacterized protein n=1 Tax=Undibacterium oligocarboniphilum TaxID=666702 RepID=A0A850QNV4_9BURK|nr:hypothetical protein [Undibacterium oligocarboniphilum]MBC3869367.1 hypothetical protein [Undibacterium oligocarboniphilum]NVO77746.1 hypothetical protein [Undibacterium oligocarboniphilum]
MKLKFSLLLAISLISSICFALETRTAGKPAGSPPDTPSQSVFVVGAEDLPQAASGVRIDVPTMEQEKVRPSIPVTAAQVWSGPVPLSGVLFVLVASMPVLASLYFAYQLFLFIRARKRRLSVHHRNEP